MNPLWTLLSIVLGAMLSMGSAYVLERTRWRQQRREKLDEVKREALIHALAWIDPMEAAVNNAEIEIYGLLNGARGEREFRRRYPDLMSDLTKLELSPDQRLVLDADPYVSGHRIVRAVQDLKHQAIDLWGRTSAAVEIPSLSAEEARYQCSMRAKQLREQVAALKKQLGEEYRKTFG